MKYAVPISLATLFIANIAIYIVANPVSFERYIEVLTFISQREGLVMLILPICIPLFILTQFINTKTKIHIWHIVITVWIGLLLAQAQTLNNAALITEKSPSRSERVYQIMLNICMEQISHKSLYELTNEQANHIINECKKSVVPIR